MEYHAIMPCVWGTIFQRGSILKVNKSGSWVCVSGVGVVEGWGMCVGECGCGGWGRRGKVIIKLSRETTSQPKYA